MEAPALDVPGTVGNGRWPLLEINAGRIHCVRDDEQNGSLVLFETRESRFYAVSSDAKARQRLPTA